MKHPRIMGWLLSAVSWGVSSSWAQESLETHSAALPVSTVALRPEHADFRSHRASHDVRAVADWAVRSGDHQNLPFVVVDKIHARVFVFSPAGALLGVSPALLGLARGDDGVAGIGERALSQILPTERTTPAGRFMAALDSNLAGQAILWVDYELGISLHPVRSASPRERRLERLASSSEKDNRISYGCINVSAAFWHGVVQPTFANTVGVVYVLPETRPLNKVFAM
jgi:hypothetical protein